MKKSIQKNCHCNLRCNSLTRLFFHCFTLIRKDNKNDWRKLDRLTKYVCKCRIQDLKNIQVGKNVTLSMLHCYAFSRWVRNINLYSVRKATAIESMSRKRKCLTENYMEPEPPPPNPPSPLSVKEKEGEDEVYFLKYDVP